MNRRHSSWLRRSLVGFVFIGMAVFTLHGATAKNLRVIDGDTLVLNGETIRLEGIDAPELGQTCKKASGITYRCGQMAKAFLETLVRQGSVTCRGSETDGYDRRLATCYADSQDLNQKMVENGQAFAFKRYSQQYVAEEASARTAMRGFWSGTVVPPWDFRKQKWQIADQTAPDGCPIKGNISDRGRIYHTPWSPHYSRTRINEKTGERWFCSEIEALAAGWRPPSG